MVPAEFVAQDHAYQMLKLRLWAREENWTEPINIVALADALGLSRTPVREALFRLMGEGLIEQTEAGGCRRKRLNPARLVELYQWSEYLMLMALSIISASRLETLLQCVRSRHLAEQIAHYGSPVAAIFETMGKATGSSEISRQVLNLNERSILARIAEARLFEDGEVEFGRFLKSGDQNLKGAMKRRLIAYHRRRIDHAELISDALIATEEG